jgi:hypothetical protein
MTGDAYVFGCTRTPDMDRLCGWYYYGAAETSREEVLIKALARGTRINGARPDRIVMNDVDLAALVIESQGRMAIVQDLIKARNSEGPIAQIGFSGIRMATGQGVVDVFADRDMPLGVAFAYPQDTLQLEAVNKEFPYIDDRGGGLWKHVEVRTTSGSVDVDLNLDRFQMVGKGYCTFKITEPQQCGVIVLPTVSTY